MAVNSFKHSLYHRVPAAQDHGVVGTGEIGHMDVGSNLNPWVTLQGLVKNPVGNVIEEGRGEEEEEAYCVLNQGKVGVRGQV